VGEILIPFPRNCGSMRQMSSSGSRQAGTVGTSRLHRSVTLAGRCRTTLVLGTAPSVTTAVFRSNCLPSRLGGRRRGLRAGRGRCGHREALCIGRIGRALQVSASLAAWLFCSGVPTGGGGAGGVVNSCLTAGAAMMPLVAPRSSLNTSASPGQDGLGWVESRRRGCRRQAG
jgi:hypothetical protein